MIGALGYGWCCFFCNLCLNFLRAFVTYFGDCAGLGLQEKTIPPIHAKICHKSSQTIQAQVTKKQHQPYPSAPIINESKKQYATPTSIAPFLDIKGKKFIQQVCGKFIFLGRAVDSTLSCLISAIASQSATRTEDTMQHTQQLLDYM